MKILLEFDVPEDNEEAEDALNGSDWHVLVQDITNEIGSQIKHMDHPPKGFSNSFKDGLAWAYSTIFNFTQERELMIWK